MVLFPAIDILSGKAVRLYKGDYNAVTVYSERPWEFAEDFRKGVLGHPYSGPGRSKKRRDSKHGYCKENCFCGRPL